MAVRSIRFIKQHADGATQQIAVLQGGTVTVQGDVGVSVDRVSVYSATAKTYLNAAREVAAPFNPQELLHSVASVVPHSDGRLFITGDACTQLVSYAGQEQDPDITVTSQTGLVVLDQCPACNDCSTKWSILQRIQTLQLILAGFKDNQLYVAQTANQVWALMDKLRITEGQATGTCQAAPDMTQRDAYVLPARQLLIQYKALVQMWNYLVYRGNRRLRIKAAPGNPQGIAISAQYRTTSCYARGQGYRLRLSVSATIVSGQVHAKGTCLVRDRLALFIADPKARHTSDADGTETDIPVTRSGYTYGDGRADSVRLACEFTPQDTCVCGLTAVLLPTQAKTAQELGQFIYTQYQYQVNRIQTTQLVLGAPGPGIQIPDANIWQVQVTWQLIKYKQDGSAYDTIQSSTQTKLYSTSLCPVIKSTTTRGKLIDVRQDPVTSQFYCMDILDPQAQPPSYGRVTLYPVLGNNQMFTGTVGTQKVTYRQQYT